jgi:hypothetical protein
MRGICFKEPMFNLATAGTKTQTRRSSGLEEINRTPDDYYKMVQSVCTFHFYAANKLTAHSRYKLNEILYLKEPYFLTKDIITYKYGNDLAHIYQDRYWANKLFMAEKYARYFIKITGIQAQRINDISEADALAEGFITPGDFHNYWLTMYGFSSLKSNLWVFAYDFQLHNNK